VTKGSLYPAEERAIAALLSKLSERDLYAIPGVGRQTVRCVRGWLESRGKNFQQASRTDTATVLAASAELGHALASVRQLERRLLVVRKMVEELTRGGDSVRSPR
jgi:hypothetical protein